MEKEKEESLVSVYVNIPENILSFDFDTHDIDECFILKNIALYLFQQVLQETQLSVQSAHFIHFIDLVCAKYHQNPFHNFKHAINVLHMAYVLVKQVQFAHKIKPHVLFGLYIAALCHDVDHPGHTNSYEVNSFSKYAKLYNDKSVLENHHCAMTFALLEESGLVSMFQGVEFVEFRRTVIRCILGTDISKHEKCMHQIKHFDATKSDYSMEEQYIFCKVMVHCADLSSSIKPFDTYFIWAKRISKEFYEQYMKERNEGITSSPYMMGYDDLSMSLNEISFITNTIVPMWELFCATFDHVDFTLNKCKENLEKWRELNQYLVGLASYT